MYPEEVADDVVFGRRPVLEALTHGAPVRVLLASEKVRSQVVGEIRAKAEGSGIPIRVVPRAEIDRLARGGNHQGVVAVTAPYRYRDLDDLLRVPAARLVFLDGVMDPHNLGSLLRTADGAGFHGIVIRSHRSVQVTAAVRRVAAGAAEVVPVARVPNLARALERAKASGLWIVGLTQEAEADIWTSDVLEPPIGLVLGAEDRGISRVVTDQCDLLLRVPKEGKLASLNVAVTGAVAMFEVARRAATALARGNAQVLDN